MNSILVVGPSWIGDMMMAHSLFQVLKERHPDCSIDVLAPGWSLPLLERMPEVRAGIDMPVGHGRLQLGLRRSVARQLKENQYQQAIILPGSLKSALIPFFARIPRRTAYRGEQRFGLISDMRPLDKAQLSMTVQRFVNLALEKGEVLPDPIPAPRLVVDDSAVQIALVRHGLVGDREKPILGLCPGAEYGPAKRWPSEYYAEIAQTYSAKGWAVWIFGSNKDEAVAEEIQKLSDGSCINLCGKTSLSDAVDLMSCCRKVISNDSGLMHVAAALGKKLIAIYGSSDPGFTPPLNNDAEVMTLGLSCSPCFKRTCPLGHTRCLNDLMPEQVLERMESS